MRFSQITYRAHSPEWAWDPLSGEGAKRHGGRFNPVGMPALYMSLDPVTAIVEASPLGRPFQPLTLCAYRVSCENILDLTDRAKHMPEGVDPSNADSPSWQFDMLEGREPSSHHLARHIIDQGYFGVISKSYASGADRSAKNLLLWVWNKGDNCKVEVIDDDLRLPRNRLSWD